MAIHNSVDFGENRAGVARILDFRGQTAVGLCGWMSDVDWKRGPYS